MIFPEICFTIVTGAATQIAVASNGTPWVVANGSIFQFF